MVEEQLTRYTERLRVYRDRMLHVDWRNRSILLRRTEKRWNFDLASLWNEELDNVEDVLGKAVRTRGPICLVRDSDQSEEAESVRSSLVQLERSSRLIFEETGVRDTFLGFPFLVGKAGKESVVRAPLILFPIFLERRREGLCGWYLNFSEDEEPVANRALVAALRKECGITLPDDIQDQIDDLLEGAPKGDVGSHLLLGMQGLLRHAGLDLRDAEAGEFVKPLQPMTAEDLTRMQEEKLHLEGIPIIGSFPQGSTAIFRDYEDMLARAGTGEADQGIVDDLLEAPALRSGGTELAKKADIDSVPDREINLALPTDSSQDLVILEAQGSECIVVRGPPGTGKSQVIVNLITNALAKDEKVLVVCQKRAALDVVYQRLDRAGLADAAVLLHDARADRPGAYATLAKRVEGDPPGCEERLEREFEDVSKQIDDTIAELNGIVKPMWAEYFGGARLQELYSAAMPGYLPRLGLGNVPNRLTKQSLRTLLQKLPNLQIGHWKYDAPTSVIAKRRSFAALDTNVRFDMEAALSRMTALALPSTMVLDTLEEQRSALLCLDDYERLKPKFTRFLSGRWRRANRMMQRTSSLYPNDPRLAQMASLRLALNQGQELLSAMQDMQSWLRPEGAEEMRHLQRNPNALKGKLEAMRMALTEFDAIQEHDRLVSSLDSTGAEVLDMCARNLPITEGSWARTLEQEVIARWVGHIESQNQQLTGDPFHRYLELKWRLDDLLTRRRELFRKHLMLKVLDDARRPQLPPGEHHPNKRPETDWNRLLNEFTKKRRVKPARKVMEEFPFQMMRICPCWLVSPEAASDILPLKRGLFDLVIFDESSQLAVERALPSIYRGKRVVIAGDEKQLRPFDLFHSKDDDEQLDEVTEAESLLVLSMRIFTPRYLSWHYRSRYQELIDFSNHAFYDGNLEIAANVQRTFPMPPIEFVRVPGVWDERTNHAEAKKVVDVMATLLKDGERKGKLPSIGVITFNEPQRDLIEDLVDERRSRSQDFERLYSAATSSERNLDDRPFVKNIENVQGDERDVIVFSVGYAPDAQGQFRVQFGSLNQEGGENRLNVAVTRARERVIMVASFDPSSLPVEGVKNLGPKRLKEYLCYAQAVSEARHQEVQELLARLDSAPRSVQEAMAFSDLEKPLEMQVKEALEARGHHVDERVGFSGYRIDLAVVDPADESRYILGIECDGATFHSARSARERDVVRQRFLEERGWNIDRIWSRNWWRNRNAELDRLEARIGALSGERARSTKNTGEVRIGSLERQSKDLLVETKQPEERRDRPPESLADELPGEDISPGKDDRSMKFIFYTQLEAANSKITVQAAESLLDWAEEAGTKLWWREFHGVTTVTPYFKHKDTAHWFFSIRADGNVDLHFQYLKPPFESRERKSELIRRLNKFSELDIPEEYHNKVRAVRLQRLAKEGSLGGFLKVIEWYMNEVKRS